MEVHTYVHSKIPIVPLLSIISPSPADLIMLGLATHEPHFTILREEFKPNQPRPCDICGQVGHDMKECTGAAKSMEGEVLSEHAHA